MSQVWSQSGRSAVLVVIGVVLIGCVERASVGPSRPFLAPSRPLARADRPESVRAEPPVDCDSARVMARGSVYSADGKLLRQLGPVATGTWTPEGDDFAALIFFATVREAKFCEPRAQIAVWDEYEGKWRKP